METSYIDFSSFFFWGGGVTSLFPTYPFGLLLTKDLPKCLNNLPDLPKCLNNLPEDYSSSCLYFPMENTLTNMHVLRK